ncbi:PREDICTED: probable 3-hydroxyisobutyrate dehydrogenase-like 2, mitochondrial [Theobroma cacao]|uniref:Probable 3-hydroxyisobutyrate dehydrogenase-like 2, mitochondrial n=1 Tax=Theobroma cacao TaxID=3641 RepID=A0AB32VTW9_THECC|nr:PREDICTED: probable 3-hydroxyisobutyrate dehydrogenase-like 2, mitochondrial [Theobroma cacao]
METPYPKPISPAETRVGWIGIGIMGAAMASHLLSAGYSLTIYARTPSKASSLQSQGAHITDSPQELARRCNVVFTMVGNPQDVKQIVLETNGVLSTLNPGAVLVDHTTSSPSLAREIYASARKKGCWSIDAPVSGGDIGAREGKLAIFAGGESSVVEWLKPLFDLMGRVTYMGEAGCGQSCKIGNQIMVGANLMGLSEGFVFAEKAGLDLRKYMEAVRGGGAASMAMELFGGRMIRRDFKPGGFAEYMVKDMGLGVDVVKEDDDGKVVVLPGAALGKQMFSAMVANGDGKLGTQGLITVVERINGK